MVVSQTGKIDLSFLNGKRVFVSGGTGSFGKTLVALCLEASEAKEVVVFSRDEQKHVKLRRTFDDNRLTLMIGDVRDLERLRLGMRGIDLVLNAAAIKHVHLTETNPTEAVATNIIGANNVCLAALEAGVECVVTLSTDKAVEPVNVMGMTKALQERVVASYAGKGMRVGIVRYGNVLASEGSVIPYFKELLEKGGNLLPVTDRRMTRFVLTLKDSVNLVMLALERSNNGETFVLDLPAFRMWDVAEVMVNASNKSSVTVGEVGIRPGEKIHETLISREEMRRATSHSGYWCIHTYQSDQERFSPGIEEKALTSDSVYQMSKDEIHALLRKEGCLPNL